MSRGFAVNWDKVKTMNDEYDWRTRNPMAAKDEIIEKLRAELEIERAIKLVTTMMREFPEKYATRGKAFRVEFFTNDSNGEMLAFMHEEEPELTS